MKRKIFVVDDHAVTRKGYAFLIGEEPDLMVCGEAASALEALDQIPEANPDLLIADLTMEGMSGIELIKHLQSQRPDLPVLAISMHDEALYADRALRAGARGYLMKNEAGPKVVDAVRRILRGGLYVSEAVSDKILTQFSGRPPSAGSSPVDDLSDRELEVLEHLGRGLKTSEIAEAMMISPNTVESYRSRLKGKLGLKDAGELLRYAMQHAQQEGLL